MSIAEVLLFLLGLVAGFGLGVIVMMHVIRHVVESEEYADE